MPQARRGNAMELGSLFYNPVYTFTVHTMTEIWMWHFSCAFLTIIDIIERARSKQLSDDEYQRTYTSTRPPNGVPSQTTCSLSGRKIHAAGPPASVLLEIRGIRVWNQYHIWGGPLKAGAATDWRRHHMTTHAEAVHTWVDRWQVRGVRSCQCTRRVTDVVENIQHVTCRRAMNSRHQQRCVCTCQPRPLRQNWSVACLWVKRFGRVSPTDKCIVYSRYLRSPYVLLQRRQAYTQSNLKVGGVSSCSSLGWPAGWPHLRWGPGGARIPDDIVQAPMIECVV